MADNLGCDKLLSNPTMLDKWLKDQNIPNTAPIQSSNSSKLFNHSTDVKDSKPVAPKLKPVPSEPSNDQQNRALPMDECIMLNLPKESTEDLDTGNKKGLKRKR